MNQLRYSAALAAIALIGAAHAGTTWTAAQDTSKVGFTFEQQGSKYNGVFEEFTATIDFDPAAPESGSIVGTVVTESVNTRDYDRDAQLTDVDFFDAAKHPEAKFVSESIEAAGDGSYVANGQLTLKGKTEPMALTFTFDLDGDSAVFNGKMKVNRFDFNVGEGWNDTSWVGQNVDVEISLNLSR